MDAVCSEQSGGRRFRRLHLGWHASECGHAYMRFVEAGGIV